MVTLRPLFFAYEDRDQITLLFTETLRLLKVAADGKMDQSRVVCLWNKINAIMTDAVTKNFSIESAVADALGSDHIPYHILCTQMALQQDRFSTKLTNLVSSRWLKT